MKIIKNHNLCFKIGDTVRIKDLKDLTNIYTNICMPSMTYEMYGTIHTIKSIENHEYLDVFRKCHIKLNDVEQTVFSFELEYYEDNK